MFDSNSFDTNSFDENSFDFGVVAGVSEDHGDARRVIQKRKQKRRHRGLPRLYGMIGLALRAFKGLIYERQTQAQ